jgi:transposase
VIGSTRQVAVWAYGAPADLRKGFDGLSALVAQGLGRDLLSGDCYLFVNATRKRVKVLLLDGTGLCIYAKRLEQGRFACLWRDAAARVVRLTMSAVERECPARGGAADAAEHAEFRQRRAELRGALGPAGGGDPHVGPGAARPAGEQPRQGDRLHARPLAGPDAFLDDPRIPLDNNATERALRGMVIGRRNHYGSRSKRGAEVAALSYSLIESAKLCGVEPKTYLLRALRAALAAPGTVTLPHTLTP